MGRAGRRRGRSGRRRGLARRCGSPSIFPFFETSDEACVGLDARSTLLDEGRGGLVRHVMFPDEKGDDDRGGARNTLCAIVRAFERWAKTSDDGESGAPWRMEVWRMERE